jgi:hypothetical protein
MPVLTTPAPAAEVTGTCPYISNADFQAYEGDHVGRVTVLQSNPVGCRFYFFYQPSDIIGEVHVQVFADAFSANNAMVLAARSHPEVQSNASIGDGAIAIQTPLQGENTWEALVTIGNRVYQISTRQTRPSLASYAFNLAQALVATVR